MDLLIFDLDGTLVDSKQDLVNSVNATRASLGLVPIADDVVASYVGNGAPTLVRRALGPEFGDEQVDQALQYFLAWYRDHMLDHTRLYDGVREALDELRGAGVAMAVLTNKPVRFSQTMIERLGLGDHFFRVYGGNSFEQKKPDPVGVDALLTESRATRARTMMVGDSAVDVRTARNAGILACGVTWGFQPDSLASDPPDVSIDSMGELPDLVLGGRDRIAVP
jgi:phosphoglycolate phosphatase